MGRVEPHIRRAESWGIAGLVLPTQDDLFVCEEATVPAAQQKLEVLFKATEGGYVFRAPNPWVVGQAKHYLVTEAQKAEIQNIMDVPAWVIGVFWLAFFALCFGGGTLLLYVLSGNPEPTTVDIVIMMLSGITGALLPLPLIGYWQLHRLNPIIRTLHPTSERISLREMKAARKATRAREYARNCMLSGFAFGVMMLNVGFSLHIAITRGSYITLVLWSVAAILSGSGMVQNARLAMRKASET